MIIMLALLAGCGHKNGFEKGSDAYNLAKKLSEKITVLDPDKDAAVAEADGFKVYASQVIEQIRNQFGKQAETLAQQPESNITRIVKEFAEREALKRILLQEAADKGIRLDATEVDSIYNSVAARMGGEEKFLERLKENKLDVKTFKSNIREGETINTLLKQIANEQVKPDSAALDSAKQVDRTASVRHILLKTQGMDEAQKAKVHKKMEGILKRARRGEDFAKLANKYTEDPGNNNKDGSKNGGLYKDFGRGRMVKPFEDAAFNVPVGQISDIIETTYGYHILKVVERKKDTRPDKVIMDEILRKQRNQAIENYLDSLKTAHHVKVLLDS